MKQIRSLARTGMAVLAAAAVALAAAGCTDANTIPISSSGDVLDDGDGAGSGADVAGDSGSGTSGGGSSSGGSFASGTPTYPTFSGGEIFKGDYSEKSKDYYYFESSTSVTSYELSTSSNVLSKSQTYTYSSSDGSLTRSGKNDPSRYLWLINGTYYMLDDDPMQKTSGSGLSATFSAQGENESGNQITVTYTFTSNGIVEGSMTDSSGNTEDYQGTYTNTNGLITITADGETMYLFYDGTSLYWIDYTLTEVNSLPSSSS